MKALGYALATLAGWLLRLAGRVLVIAARCVLLLALPLASLVLRRRRQRGRKAVAAPHPNDAPHADNVTPAAAPVQLEAPVPAHASNTSLAVADRIVSLRLDPPVGVIHLRIYQARGIVRRELIVLEPCLRNLLKGRRHPLPDVSYDPVDGLEAIKNQAVEAAEEFINARGNAGRQRSARPGGPRPDRAPSAAPPTKETAQQAPPATAAAATPVPVPSAATLVAPQASTGYCYVGTLVKAGTATVTPEGRPPYDIFEATLQLDNGAELALRGAELQRELAACRCTLGQRIAITPMGKVPIALANGTEGRKNLYRVQLADAAQAAAPP